MWLINEIVNEFSFLYLFRIWKYLFTPLENDRAVKFSRACGLSAALSDARINRAYRPWQIRTAVCQASGKHIFLLIRTRSETNRQHKPYTISSLVTQNSSTFFRQQRDHFAFRIRDRKWLLLWLPEHRRYFSYQRNAISRETLRPPLSPKIYSTLGHL